MSERSSVLRLLANPFGWIAFQVGEIVVFGLCIRLLVPDGWSTVTRLTVIVPILLVVVWLNYRIRRRLPPIWEPSTTREPPERG